MTEARPGELAVRLPPLLPPPPKIARDGSGVRAENELDWTKKRCIERSKEVRAESFKHVKCGAIVEQRPGKQK